MSLVFGTFMTFTVSMRTWVWGITCGITCSESPPAQPDVVPLCYDTFCGFREHFKCLVAVCIVNQRGAGVTGERVGDRNLPAEWKATGARVGEGYKTGWSTMKGN